MRSALHGLLVVGLVALSLSLGAGSAVAAPDATPPTADHDDGLAPSDRGSTSVTVAESVFRTAGSPPNVTIASRNDFPVADDRDVTRRIHGTVSGVDVDERSTATVTVDGDRSFTT